MLEQEEVTVKTEEIDVMSHEDIVMTEITQGVVKIDDDMIMENSQN